MRGDVEAPVTVVARRRVRKGREQAYEAWLSRLIAASSDRIEGFLGAEVIRPSPDAHETAYTSIFRFSSHETLGAFEKSELRAGFMDEVRDFVEGDAVWERMTGLELWFTPPPGTVVPQPSRFRMALLLVVVVYGLVLSIGSLVGLVIGHWPYPLRLLVTISIEVFLMTYVVMPRLTQLLARWIYPTTQTK